MKKLFLVPILLIILSLVATPAFAADPPDMEVDIAVSTGGDVDMDIGVNAGGDVDITIDGVDFKQTAGLAQAAYLHTKERSNTMWDYTYYWNITGIGDMVMGAINELRYAIEMLFVSQLELQEQLNATNARIDELEDELDELALSSRIRTLELERRIEALE